MDLDAILDETSLDEQFVPPAKHEQGNAMEPDLDALLDEAAEEMFLDAKQESLSTDDVDNMELEIATELTKLMRTLPPERAQLWQEWLQVSSSTAKVTSKQIRSRTHPLSFRSRDTHDNNTSRYRRGLRTAGHTAP
jgi:hypothetical protein